MFGIDESTQQNGHYRNGNGNKKNGHFQTLGLIGGSASGIMLTIYLSIQSYQQDMNRGVERIIDKIEQVNKGELKIESKQDILLERSDSINNRLDRIETYIYRRNNGK